jgi:hypothetical protein
VGPEIDNAFTNALVVVTSPFHQIVGSGDPMLDKVALNDPIVNVADPTGVVLPNLMPKPS